MSATRQAYEQAAASAAALLADPAVAAAWERPSALPEFGVAGLAGHLAAQVLHVPAVLAGQAPPDSPITLADHYGRVAWIGSGVDADINVEIRRGGERVAVDGPAALAARVAEAVRSLPDLLAGEPVERVVHLPWTGWALLLDDFLVTRAMEIAVHADDLAVSVGIETPDLPEPAFGLALDLLSRLAARRHGQAAVLRALSRAERAPASITAF
jgi:hypothetical protein